MLCACELLHTSSCSYLVVLPLCSVLGSASFEINRSSLSMTEE